MEHKLGGGNRSGDVSPIRTVHARSELGLVLQQIFSLFSPWEFRIQVSLKKQSIFIWKPEVHRKPPK